MTVGEQSIPGITPEVRVPCGGCARACNGAMSDLLQFVALLYALSCSCAAAGVIVRSGARFGRRVEVHTWNSRVESRHRPSMVAAVAYCPHAMV